MRRIVLFGIAILTLCLGTLSSRAAAGASLEGSWEGVILVKPAEFEVEVRIEIARAADGTLGGHLVYPHQGKREYPLDKVQLDGGSVLLTSTDPQGTVSVFQGVADLAAGTIRGDLVEGGQKAPFNLRRRSAEAVKKAELETLTPDGSALKARFNSEAGKVRVLVIVAPSCAICRMGARLVQRHLLAAVPDSQVSLYFLWERISSNDNPEVAQQAADLVADDRVRQYWSNEHFGASTFMQPVGIQRTGAWDVFLLFPPGAKWLEVPPPFASFLHNQKQHEELPKDRLLNADLLVSEVRKLAAGPQAP